MLEPGELLRSAISATRGHNHGVNVTLCRCNTSPYYCWWWTSHICCCKKKIKSCGVWQDSRDTFAWLYSLWQSYLKRFSTQAMEKMSHPYLIFVIFLHKQNFWRIKFTPKKRIYYDKIHSKLPIFCVKSVKIYTGQKFFTRTCPWRPWQISGMMIPV